MIISTVAGDPDFGWLAPAFISLAMALAEIWFRALLEVTGSIGRRSPPTSAKDEEMFNISLVSMMIDAWNLHLLTGA
jgi:hypothetical protein